MNLFNKKTMIVMALSSVISLSGCANNSQTSVEPMTQNCSLPHSKQLLVAVEESRATLSNHYCQSGYAEHFAALIDIAAGEPKGENLGTFGLQSQWMAKQGIISKKESESMLRRYFSPQLVSLDYESSYNTYSHCSMQSKQNQIDQLLNQELEQKRKGLSMALGDHEAYQMAVKEYQSVSLLLESTQQACQQAQR